MPTHIHRHRRKSLRVGVRNAFYICCDFHHLPRKIAFIEIIFLLLIFIGTTVAFFSFHYDQTWNDEVKKFKGEIIGLPTYLNAIGKVHENGSQIGAFETEHGDKLEVGFLALCALTFILVLIHIILSVFIPICTQRPFEVGCLMAFFSLLCFFASFLLIRSAIIVREETPKYIYLQGNNTTSEKSKRMCLCKENCDPKMMAVRDDTHICQKYEQKLVAATIAIIGGVLLVISAVLIGRLRRKKKGETITAERAFLPDSKMHRLIETRNDISVENMVMNPYYNSEKKRKKSLKVHSSVTARHSSALLNEKSAVSE